MALYSGNPSPLPLGFVPSCQPFSDDNMHHHIHHLCNLDYNPEPARIEWVVEHWQCISCAQRMLGWITEGQALTVVQTFCSIRQPNR